MRDDHISALNIDGRSPVESLRLVRAWRDRLTLVEDEAVAYARAAGLNWGEIGRNLGRSRQLLRQKYTGREAELQELLDPIDDDIDLIEVWNSLPDPKPSLAAWIADELMSEEGADNFVVG